MVLDLQISIYLKQLILNKTGDGHERCATKQRLGGTVKGAILALRLPPIFCPLDVPFLVAFSQSVQL